MANGNGSVVGPHRFVKLVGKTDKNGYPFCKDCLKTELDGKHIHEFERNRDTMATTGVDDYVLARCDVCGEPEDSEMHFHEFKLAFGELYCSICLERVDAPQHQGVDMEGITERPVREVAPLISNEEFWDKVQASERSDKKRVFFPTFGSSTTAGKISIEEDQESADELISRANPKVYFDENQKVLTTEAPKNPHSFFTKGDKVVMGGLSLVLVGNSIIGVYNLFH